MKKKEEETNKETRKGELSHRNIISKNIIIKLDDLSDLREIPQKKNSLSLLEPDILVNGPVITNNNKANILDHLSPIINKLTPGEIFDLDSISSKSDDTVKKEMVNDNQDNFNLQSDGNSGDLEDIDIIITKLKYNKKHKNKKSHNNSNSNTLVVNNDNSVSTVDLKNYGKHHHKDEKGSSHSNSNNGVNNAEKSVDGEDNNAFFNFVNSKKQSKKFSEDLNMKK